MSLEMYPIRQMKSFRDVHSFIHRMKTFGTRQTLDLDLRATHGIFPNAAVPMAVALQYFRSQGMRITARNVCEDVRRTHFCEPLNSTPENLERESPTNVVWRYRSEVEAEALCESFVNALEETAPCEYGVIDALNWCLFEVMDNVFQHSQSSCGYAMIQIHSKNPRFVACISDDGIGIHKSFIDNNVYSAKDAYEAIMLATREGVTSKTKNAGNGLYGLMRVVGINRGSLVVRSGRGYMQYMNRKVEGGSSMSIPLLDATDHQGTTIDWQIDLRTPVTLTEALGTTRPNYRLERIENNEGEHVVLVSEFEEGLGTRRSAEQIRNKLENYLAEGAPVLVLDFKGINVVSSSFADEVLGKLALRMGIVNFTNRFRLENMTTTVQAIVDRAITQRLAGG
jgi:hypothetical protein